MNGCYKFCKLNTMALIYGLLQVLLWNSDTSIEKMDRYDWCRQITDFFQYIHSSNEGSIIISNYDISLLQLLFYKNTVNAWLQLFFYNRKRVIHRTGGCNWNCELTQYLSNTYQMHCIYAIHGCKCSSKKYLIHWGMLLSQNKETPY